MVSLALDPESPPRTMSRKEWKQSDRWRRIMEKSLRDTMRDQIGNLATSGAAPVDICQERRAIEPNDLEILALRDELHGMAIAASRLLAELPEKLSLDAERAAINDILRPGDEIARKILNMRPATTEGMDARLRAGFWLGGRYVEMYLHAGQGLSAHS